MIAFHNHMNALDRVFKSLNLLGTYSHYQFMLERPGDSMHHTRNPAVLVPQCRLCMQPFCIFSGVDHVFRLIRRARDPICTLVQTERSEWMFTSSHPRSGHGGSVDNITSVSSSVGCLSQAKQMFGLNSSSCKEEICGFFSPGSLHKEDLAQHYCFCI